jgi:hypothetical protein
MMEYRISRCGFVKENHEMNRLTLFLLLAAFALVAIAPPEGRAMDCDSFPCALLSADGTMAIRGDGNVDGKLDVADMSGFLRYLFQEGPRSPCRKVWDFNNDQRLDITDADGAPGREGIWSFLLNQCPWPDPFFFNSTLDCDSYIITPPPVLASFALEFDGAPLEVTGQPGETKTFEVLATLTTSDNTTDEGAAAWSFGIGAENLKILSIATDGTDARALITVGFFKETSEVVDPLRDTGSGPQGEGAVSAVLIDAYGPVTLPVSGTVTLVKIVVQAVIPDRDLEARISFVGGKQASGRPVACAIALAGTSHAPLLGSRAIALRSVPPGGLVFPGDANRDGELDLSDAIWLLGHLFLGSNPALPCEGGTASNPGSGDLALVDVNGDGTIDLSDGVSLLSFLFLGSKPPALGTECVPIVGCPEKCQ